MTVCRYWQQGNCRFGSTFHRWVILLSCAPRDGWDAVADRNPLQIAAASNTPTAEIGINPRTDSVPSQEERPEELVAAARVRSVRAALVLD